MSPWVFRPIVIRQSHSGLVGCSYATFVPMGVFPRSSHLWCRACLLVLAAAVQLCPPYLPARPPAQVVLTGPCDWTMAPSVASSMLHHGLLMTSPNARLVTEHDLNERGFRGWWAPVDRLLGTIQIESHVVMLANTAPWDGAPCGRLHTIVRHTPAMQRGRVGDFLKCYNPVFGVVGEILQPLPWDAPVDALSSDDENLPFVLLSRYRDNLYMIFANIPEDILPTVRFFVAALLRSTYGIALKWEIHDSVVVWGEGAISCPFQGRLLSLLRKGASRTLEEAIHGEHLKWIHPASPNARYVWRSQLPALFTKSIWYAWSTDDLVTNLRSLVWNLILKGYPVGWWKPQFLRCWDKYRLQQVFPLHLLHAWVREGKQGKCSLPGP